MYLDVYTLPYRRLRNLLSMSLYNHSNVFSFVQFLEPLKKDGSTKSQKILSTTEMAFKTVSLYEWWDTEISCCYWPLKTKIKKVTKLFFFTFSRPLTASLKSVQNCYIDMIFTNWHRLTYLIERVQDQHGLLECFASSLREKNNKG